MSIISSFPAPDERIFLDSISITTPPTKTSYYVGDSFNNAGMVVTATYDNNATMLVTSYSVEPMTMTYGLTFVAITYTEEGITRSVTQPVTVSKQSMTVPTQSGSLTYTGETQIPTWNNYDSSKMSVSGTTSAINAGSYTVTFSLLDSNSCIWSDGTTTDKAISWSIVKATGSLSIDTTSITLDTSNLSKTITVTRLGDGTITAVSDNTSVATTSISGNIITVSSVNNTTGSATITVSVAEGTNYTAPPDTACSVTASFISTTLNNNSWAVIKSVNSTGSSYWSVGDCKAVTLNGTVGAYTFSSETYYCYILGFNHNPTYEGNGIHFQFGKTALTGGTDICFVDSSYGSSASSSAFHMNSSNTNTGGWNSSYMRQTLCNSQFKLVLPSDLQSVLKQQTKYTDNTGGGSDTASYVTSTLDYIFLLAEYEVFGARTLANSAEQNYQKQYQYYINGNSKVKYRHNLTTTFAGWWLRSPYCYASIDFCGVYTSGSATGNGAYYSYGFAPGFVI